MAISNLRGEPEDDFREGSPYSVTLRTNLGEDIIALEAFEEEFRKSRGFHFELSERERLAQTVRKRHEDEVVAVDSETGEEIAVAKDTHELTKILKDLEYNEEGTMIVRCYGGEKGNSRSSASEISRPGLRERAQDWE